MEETSYKNPEILKKIENYCSYQERCKKEVIEKFFILNLDQSELDDVINHLINNDYINEERFALAFAQGRFRIKKWGKIKIILELKKRAIDVNLINKAINQITDSDYIGTFDKLSLKKYKSFDVITANNVFAHIDDIQNVFLLLKNLMHNKSLIIFEVSYLLDVIKKKLFDTIYHEHLDYHSVIPLIYFFKKMDLKIIDI